MRPISTPLPGAIDLWSASLPITPDLQRRFVATLAVTGIVKQAARSIGRSMEALYKLRARPGAEGFAAAWDEALRWGVERLEDCALERALNGGFDHDPVSGWGGRGNGLLIYLLGLRRSFRFDERDIVPGHPLYERIRAEVLAEAQADRTRLREIAAKLPPHSSP